MFPTSGEMGPILQLIQAIRNARAQLRIPSGQYLEVLVDANGLRESVAENAEAISALARVQPLRILEDPGERPPPGQAMTLVVDPLVVILPLAGVVDISAERGRLDRELGECMTNLERVEGLLADPGFSTRAPEEVVEREQQRLESLRERRERLKEVLSQLPG